MVQTETAGAGEATPPPEDVAPAVSVIISTHNDESLAVALDCLQAQTLPAALLEVLVIDDGSTDRTWEMLWSRSAGWPGLRLLRQEHAGSSVARNRGIDMSRGRYLFFHEPADHLTPDALRRLLDVAEEADADVVVGRTHRDGAGSPSGSARTVLDADLIRDKVWSSLAPWKLIRRQLVEAAGLRFPEDMVHAADQIFVAGCLLAASKVAIAGGDVHYYRGPRASTPAPPSLGDRLLTLTRMAALIVAHTEPGRRREALFTRVLLRTLPPALGAGFLAASPAERQVFLNAAQADVLIHLTDRHLSRADDRTRIRLAVARSGTPADLVEVNRLLSEKPRYTRAGNVWVRDLGERLNALLDWRWRALSEPVVLRPTLTGVDLRGGCMVLTVSLGGGPLPWSGIQVVVRRRSGNASAVLEQTLRTGSELRMELCRDDLVRAGGTVPVTPATFDLWVEGQLGDTTVGSERLRWDQHRLPDGADRCWGVAVGFGDINLKPTRHRNVSLVWRPQRLRPRAAIIDVWRVARRVRRQVPAGIRGSRSRR